MCKSNPESQTPPLESQIEQGRILVWLPSPMGDAILCTPALRAIREHFKTGTITFLATETVRGILSPGSFNDEWLELKNNNPFEIAKKLKEHKFTYAILFKNSFASALAAYLAGIPARIGYCREHRGFLLTEKLYPLKLPPRRFSRHKQTRGIRSKFKPVSMVEYYLAIARWLGCREPERNPELLIEPQARKNLSAKLPQLSNPKGPVVIIVPGGAFGPSKCWSSLKFAQTAGRLITRYNATVVVSVAPDIVERQIAEDICNSSKRNLINLAEIPLSLGELKALFCVADLVISNDTGPRHIAIALGRKVITLFGPNDPIWTDTKYENEIQIIGNVHCAPCRKSKCNKSDHLCMESISVEMVCEAAKELLENKRKQPVVLSRKEFIETEKSFFIDREYQTALSKAGLTSIEEIFSFDAARNLAKSNLASYRSRLQFEISSPERELSTTVFMKRYDCPPVTVQLGNWLSHHNHKSDAFREFDAAYKLTTRNINTPKVICYGEQRNALFETRSFIITEKIPDAESLERQLPDCFSGSATIEKIKQRRNFIVQAAAFIKKFHETKYRHRDLYFSHIFYNKSGEFYLIDLARVFRPFLLRKRFQIKDIAQVYYSAPKKFFSDTDRLRFYMTYATQSKLRRKDKLFIRKVIKKAEQMAQHDRKHDRPVPFAD
ncbi:MAG: lipopolysaccharide heptosyltransferase II [Sedimentisphaerales bacterium]|nr:lipopolysaccharide heptosyltransferase II [Sedimentisphaerales bacterium]